MKKFQQNVSRELKRAYPGDNSLDNFPGRVSSINDVTQFSDIYYDTPSPKSVTSLMDHPKVFSL